MLYQSGKPYSQDLRERVFAASDEGDRVGEIAELLQVSVSYVSKVLARRSAGLAPEAVGVRGDEAAGGTCAKGAGRGANLSFGRQSPPAEEAAALFPGRRDRARACGGWFRLMGGSNKLCQGEG
jgi:hypothetical protein